MVSIVGYLVYGRQAVRQTGKLKKSEDYLFIFYSYILNALYLFPCIVSHVLVYFIIFCSVFFLQQNNIK